MAHVASARLHITQLANCVYAIARGALAVVTAVRTAARWWVGRDAKDVKDALMAEGIMVRHYAKKELSGYIRVSVGKPEHTDALQRALQKLC